MRSLALLICLVVKWTRCVWAGEQIVYPQLLEARGLGIQEKLIQISSTHSLHLEKSSVLGDEVIVDVMDGTQRMRKAVDSGFIRDRLYQNRQHKATLLIHETTHGVVVKGILNTSHSIQPENMLKQIGGGRVAHRIREIPRAVHRHASRKVAAQKQAILEERSWPYENGIALPVSIIVDTVHRASCASDSESIEYAAIMMNAVNLRFEQIPEVNMQLMLREVKILESQNEDDWVKVAMGNTLDSSVTLDRLEERADEGDPFISGAAIVLVLTGRYCFASSSGYPVEGESYTGYACRYYRFCVARDVPGTFSGVKTLCHELGHSLGLLHDGESAPVEEQGHPGAEACPSSNPYIMCGLRDCGVEHDRFSDCAASQIKWFLATYGGYCQIYTASLPPVTTPLPRKFPGRSILATQFCKLMHPKTKGIWAYTRFKDCRFYCCTPRVLGLFYTYTTYTALDGWSCDVKGKKECWHGVCSEFLADKKKRQKK
uniref:Putative secreted metalloprotease n=1 Tax=Ixodes ricinus TaxID=34613 RepID=A0A147BVR5_IXORI